MNLEIKDRVAVGDDKYIIEDLGDGRQRLIPSPDSVSEEGTKINKELLQPIVDAVPEIYEVYCDTESHQCSFLNGKVASDLYSDLENGKGVEVRCQIPNPLFTTMYVVTNTDFVKNSVSGQSVYQWAVQSPDSGMFSLVLGSDSLQGGLIPPRADYVEEQGVEDGWTYRKWSSGIAECWKTHLERVSANTTDNDVYVSFPFTFASVPFVGCSLQAGGSTNYNAFVIQGGITVSDVRLHFRNNYNGEAVIGAALSVKGRWQ